MRLPCVEPALDAGLMNEENGIKSQILDKIIILPQEVAVAVLAGVAGRMDAALVTAIFDDREGDKGTETEIQIPQSSDLAVERIDGDGGSGVHRVGNFADGDDW